VEVFMDDFSIYGTFFDNCLDNLDKVLQRCEETNLVLNWEKCHFMVNERIVLGHKISERGIKVDRAKVEAIEKRDFYFRALRSIVVLSFSQLVSFSLVLPKPLSETLRRSSDGRIPI
jgi:hypothetical protein